MPGLANVVPRALFGASSHPKGDVHSTTFRDLCADRTLRVGPYIGEIAAPGMGALLKAAGCDFAFVDMEHSGFGFDTTKGLLRA